MALDGAVSAILLILLVSSCSLFQQPPAENTTANISNTTQQNIQPAPKNDTADETRWAFINKTNVEKNCVIQAQEYAAAQGFGPGAVYGCACQADEKATTKTYTCMISALDGSHKVDISCGKEKSSCAFSVGGRTQELTLDQIYAIANR
jgi:hypothetical protein